MRHLNAHAWALAVDAVLEGVATCPGYMMPDENGAVMLRKGVFSRVHQTLAGHKNYWQWRKMTGAARDTWDVYSRWAAQYTNDRQTVTHVRLVYGTRLQRDDLERAFGARYLSLRTYAAKRASGGSSDRERVPVFPAAKVFAVFAFLWPQFDGANLLAAGTWSKLAARHLEGYTASVIDAREWTDYGQAPAAESRSQ